MKKFTDSELTEIKKKGYCPMLKDVCLGNMCNWFANGGGCNIGRIEDVATAINNNTFEWIHGITVGVIRGRYDGGLIK